MMPIEISGENAVATKRQSEKYLQSCCFLRLTTESGFMDKLPN